jgi:hypothetical protein
MEFAASFIQDCKVVPRLDAGGIPMQKDKNATQQIPEVGAIWHSRHSPTEKLFRAPKLT